MQIKFGPLRYQLYSHDAWAREAILRLKRRVEAVSRKDSAGRIIHLLEYKLESSALKGLRDGILPQKLLALLADKKLKQGWQIAGDTCGCLFAWHSLTAHTFWIRDINWKNSRPLFWLPWPLIIQDIVNMGGGLIHAGLALNKDRAWLFTAPPGGGKSTTLSRMPHNWRVLSDDASLVWPSNTGTYRASPLPTYSVMIGIQKPQKGFRRWQSARAFELDGIFFIEKAQQERLLPLEPIKASQPLYLAFSEHPRVVEIRNPFRKHFFHLASSISRAVTSWKLQLTKDGDLRYLLQDMHSNNNCLVFRYEGKSMFPIFRKDDLLVVNKVSCDQIQKGDCVLFRNFSDPPFAVHRVVANSPEIKTRGDGQGAEAEELVLSSNLIGRVKARIRNGRYSKVHGGTKGMLISRASWLARVLEPSGAGKGAKVGRFIQCLLSFVSRPCLQQIKIVSFLSASGEKNYKLMLGRAVLGKYNKDTRTWLLHWPYCLIFDTSLLALKDNNLSSGGFRTTRCTA